ncbi:MAG: YSC84-related protein [Terriglobales bacterium]
MRKTIEFAVCGLLAGGLCAAASASVSSRAEDVARLQAAERIFHEVLTGPGHTVAENVLVGGQCVAIIPGDKTFALGIGGSYGKGVAMCRDANSGRWGAPIFITLGGASVGLQLGGESADLVVVFNNMNGLENMLNNKIRLGAQASAAAGPIGRQVEASTDATLQAQVLAYARSRGLYAGVNLNGAVVQTDESGNRAMYGHAYWQDVLAGRVAAPAEARVLLTSLERSIYTNPVLMAQRQGSAGAAAQPAGQAVRRAFGPPIRPLLRYSAGIGYVHQRTSVGIDGFDLTAGMRPWIDKLPGLDIVADISRVKGTQSLLGVSATSSQWTYLFGPEFDVPRNLFTPYGHLLFGEGHLNTTVTGSPTRGSDSFAWMLGAGLKLTPARMFTIKLIQLDALHTSFNNQGSTNLRITFGVGVQF